ncbi:class I SAM-dependent methyltransferase [Portibacter lacus]|uniref:Methyltransferase n=1 Tax=Portibacter lacus TaxID=1099794 RepID=A0AA37WHQ8_9BACT|nr:class I SAM-dependent methyltransferase [Portibacter lacus]GLR19020.1 hypothetical protein GCM10007940_36360 [Portibacter lacus]
MKFENIHKRVKNVPFISKTNAKSLYEFIITNKPTNILELGIAHGTASCYIAAALDEIGNGKLTCVDLIEVKDAFIPTIEDQLLDLSKYVEVHRMQSGYNWFLHNEIKSCSNNEENICKTKYDLIIIDGPKNWTIDSSSFFLCDKLLNENGWIIWDDYSWTYADANLRRDITDGISHRSLSKEEQSIPHIKEIFHLLVIQHQNYSNFIIQDDSDWVWANKVKLNSIKKIKYVHSETIHHFLIRIIKKIILKIRKNF